MIGFAKIAGGSANSVGDMAEHLLNQTIDRDRQAVADYYQKGMVHDPIEEIAAQVADKSMLYSEALDQLIADYIQKGGDLEFLDEAEERIGKRLNEAAFRIQENLPRVVMRQDLHPVVAIGLGVEPETPLTPQQIASMIGGNRADGERIEGKKYSVEREQRPDENTGERRWSTPIGSYDFCPTPDKSISVAWAFANEAEQAAIFNAHIQASREAVAYIADEIGIAGIGAQGRDDFERGYVAWMEFTHHTTRKTIVTVENGDVKIAQDGGASGDPDLHTHFLIPNAVFCDSGRVGSLDTMGIRGFIFEADMFYHARFATLLRDAGFDAVLDERTGAAKMPIIPDDANTLFSKRSNAGEALARLYTAKQGEDWETLDVEQRQERIKRATQGVDQKKKGGKDDVADFADWQRQAKDIGWDVPQSFLRQGLKAEAVSLEERDRKAYEVGLPWLDNEFQHRSVLPHWSMRMAALRGLVATRCDGLDDIGRITKLQWTEGVMQNGEKTALQVGREPGKRYTSVSTALHESDEKEFVALAQEAFENKRGAIPERRLASAIKHSRLKFEGQHGKEQLAAIHQANRSGRMAVVRGVPGAGKTALMKPLITARKEMGWAIYGASVAWRQADELVEAGVPEQNKFALSVLIDRLGSETDNKLRLSKQSVVFVDEWGTVGVRQGLELLRFQARDGFSIVSVGDDKQTESIMAGSIFHLSQRALGEENIPNILTTIRQTDDTEQQVVRLFRENKPAEALGIKRDNGTAELIHGGREGVMKRVAELYVERLQATGVAPTISAPTNLDAHQISEAVRLERRKIGQVGPDVMTLKASDGERLYQMKLAVGDRVRLYQSTRADVGGKWKRSIGRNGSIMEVQAVDKNGMRLRNTNNGKTGTVTWSALNPGPHVDPRKVPAGRGMLAYGDAATVHTAQGSTANEHIFALPSGSQAVTGAQGYVAGTRHRHRNYLVTNERAEWLAVRESRPINDAHEITDGDKWAHVARRFLTEVKQDSALAMADKVDRLRRGTVQAFHHVAMAGPRNVATAAQQRKLDLVMAKMRQAAEATQRAYRAVSHSM